jgi:RimJ/RimL family protein N-acetyltransferase
MPGPVFLDGERVSLRTIEEEDLATLQEVVNDRRIRRPIGRSRPLNRVQEREWFEDAVCDDDTVHLLIAVESDSGPSAVGVVGLDPIDREAGTAELGYWVAPDHQQQGYGSEAVELAIGYGFDRLRLHRIAARVFAFNEPSSKLLERAGFTREGVHRDAVFVDGEYCDTHWYGLLDEEWRAADDGA